MLVQVVCPCHTGKVANMVVQCVTVNVMYDAITRNWTEVTLPRNNGTQFPRMRADLDPRSRLSLFVLANSFCSDRGFICWLASFLKLRQRGKVDSFHPSVPRLVSRLKAIGRLHSRAERISYHFLAFVLRKALSTTVDSSNRLAWWKAKFFTTSNARYLDPRYFFHIGHCTRAAVIRNVIKSRLAVPYSPSLF